MTQKNVGPGEEPRPRTEHEIGESYQGDSTTGELGEAATRCGKLGLHVFPLAPRSKVPLRGSRGCLGATDDLDQIRRFYERHPDANMGIATGPESGIIVLDIDAAHGGGRTLEMLTETHGPLPDTPRADTGGGGQHFVFAYPTDGSVIRNSAGKVGTGIDVRGEGGYIVAPPSIHPNGSRYEWDEDSNPWTIAPAPAPEWLFELVAEPDGDRRPKMTPDDWRPYADPPKDGNRNNALMRVTGKLVSALGNDSLELAVHLAWAYGMTADPPMDDAEITKVISSCIHRECESLGVE